ncbi:hypothetical protein ACFUTY_34145 [Streptomyces sp. NPDC057362]|uniref:hypothetical protein n=1 Tax=Streptomyces sp. NPDC057362 TaxID=3346106 RepID=UPI00363B4202
MPSHHLPLLLAAYQYKFGRDVEAMAQHLIDDIAVGWTNSASISSMAPRPRSWPR